MKTQLKRNTLGTRIPSLPVTSVRNATIPNQYVDPEGLQAALQTLTTARSFLLTACDQADMAARRAGTPRRTQAVRDKIDCLTDEVRAIESRIAKAAAGELEVCKGLAAGVGITLSNRKPNEIDREFDPRDRSGRFDARFRVNRDLEWEFLHRSLRDPRWYRVARATNQTGSIDPSLLTQFAKKGDPKKPKPSGQMGPPLPPSIEAVKKLRALLKDGGWGEDRLTNGELKELVKLFGGLSAASAAAVIAELSDAELKLIADDMDSSGIGNYDGLSSSEKEAFVADLAKKTRRKTVCTHSSCLRRPRANCQNSGENPRQLASETGLLELLPGTTYRYVRGTASIGPRSFDHPISSYLAR